MDRCGLALNARDCAHFLAAQSLEQQSSTASSLASAPSPGDDDFYVPRVWRRVWAKEYDEQGHAVHMDDDPYDDDDDADFDDGADGVDATEVSK